MNVEEVEIKQRSLASVKRARLKEKKSRYPDEKKNCKGIRDVNYSWDNHHPRTSNRMAERSADIIKFLFNMRCSATINHIIDKDTAEYIVKEFWSQSNYWSNARHRY